MALDIHGEGVIPDLEKRAQWLAQNTPFSREHTRGGTLDNPRQIAAALADILGKDENYIRTIQNHLAGKHPAPLSVLKAFLILFPCLSLEWLTCATTEEFERRGARFAQEMKRWYDATMMVARNRAMLERIGKAYHSGHDATPGFPLITRPGWLLDEPLPLHERTDLPPLRRDVQNVTGPTLFDGHGTYDWVKLAVQRSERPKAKDFYNGLTFRVLDIQPEDRGLAFRFGFGDYVSYLNTCEYIGAELADAQLRGETIVPGALPTRGDPAAIFDFSLRSAAAGVNCIVFLKDHEDAKRPRRLHRFVMHRRGMDTLEAQNTNHVVPAGGHQPTTKGCERDIEQGIWRTAVREFIEELFNKEEAGKLRDGGDLLDHQTVKPAVEAIFRRGCAKLFLLGVGLDPLTTKPEILVAIVIDWQKVLLQPELIGFTRREDDRSTRLSLCFEENYEGEVRYIELTPEKLLQEATAPINGRPVLPAGAACLLLAHQHFNRLFGSV